MARIRTLVTTAAVACAAALGGCMHNGTYSQAASGDIVVDSLSASRTALLRVENNYATEVRVYTVIGGKENYVAKAMPGETHTFVLDPNLFPAQSISFMTKPVDGRTPSTLGPYKVEKGETVELVVPSNFDMTRAVIHPSTK